MRIGAALLAMAIVQAPQPAQVVADLAGDPHVLSAAGITRDDTPLVTIENADPFTPHGKTRLTIVGGFDGDASAAPAVLDALRWFKTAAPVALRRRWNLSALPVVDPSGHSRTNPFMFPPAKGFFDDQAQPESRYVWRWLAFQVPDLVVIVSPEGAPSATSLAAALGGDVSGLGSVPSETVSAAALQTRLSKILAGTAAPSPLHQAIDRRVARAPLDIARTLARRYPASPIASYIPSVAWINELRLSAATGEPEWRAKVIEQTAPWIAGGKKPLGDQPPLTSIAGTMIFAVLDGERAKTLLAEGSELAAAKNADGLYKNGRGWTDDMFMATSVLARSGQIDLAAWQLIEYAALLQTASGIFVHGQDGPVAWGRGNGFAALGLMEALTVLELSHPAHANVLDIYDRQMAGLRAMQAPDGMWRQIVDEPGSYREETATAMILAAMARGIRLGWLDRSSLPVVERAWRALSAHIVEDGTLVDVCSGTGAGPTKRYYFDRPAIDGPDDRGGAMALLAAMEVYDLNKLDTLNKR